MRDDGYDIADYTGINPIYGTIDDFQRLLIDNVRERRFGEVREQAL